MNILVLDGSYFFLEGYGMVFVILIDINDNVLIFELLVYKVKIVENFLVGIYLVNVIVKDLDYGVNVYILYFMSYFKFKIDFKIGSIIMIGKLDWER